MNPSIPSIVIGALALTTVATIGAEKSKANAPAAIPDPRHISNGWNIPSEGYADQPYIVKTDDGAWLCVMTTGAGHEGQGGQHVISLRSTDQGRTWEKPVDIEPSDGPEASYAVLLKVPYGRIYAFYNHNTDNVREVKQEDGKMQKRVDSLGHYVFKYSDDHGRSWSAKRYDVPIREFECDRNNTYGGKLRFFWNVGRPLILGDAAIMVMHKVGAMGHGFFAQSEGAFFKSKNILTERDPEKITFETLPDGDIGLRTPAGGGRVAEEQSIVQLSDGSLYCVYRTVDGWPACAYSRDGGHTWTPPAYKTYTPGGQRVKHPRAANFAWNCSNGKFLYWFHNHGGQFIAGLQAGKEPGRSPYDDRNPAWLMAGREVESPQGKRIEWSQPEILLYDDDPYVRMSYPDLVEEGGKFYVTETQKNLGRVHEMPAELLDGLFNQWDNRQIAANGLALDLPAGKPMPKEAPMPKLPGLNFRDTKRADYGGKDTRAGFSLDLWLHLASLEPGQVLLDSRDAPGKGILVSTTEGGTIRVTLNDGRSQCSWDSDKGAVKAGQPQHVVITVDGGPKIITFVVNGILCDGGDQRQFGWGRFSPNLRTPNGVGTLKIAPAVTSLRIYNRALRTSEAVGNFHAGNINQSGPRLSDKILTDDSQLVRPGAAQAKPHATSPDRIAWWREAKFGMFIHWGLSSIPAGVWQGKEFKGKYAEHIMLYGKIPMSEYAKLAVEFNPQKFNANEWVGLAKRAGMRHLVFVAKHQDGFAMFDSKVSDFDIVDATPFKRDPAKELSAEVKAQGLRMGFYYSHARDHHHPLANWNKHGNTWDFPARSKEDFIRYLNEKANPQIRELLTQYGDVGVMWFDVPYDIPAEESKAIVDLVHGLQPGCLVNSRVGGESWDYQSLGDNQIADAALGEPWETCMTINDSWGYHQLDHHWKTSEQIIRHLVDIVSKGGNLLLNVGPKADGTIPEESVRCLNEVGRWMEKNKESIYGTSASPIGQPSWGRCTAKGDRLYLHVFDWPTNGELSVGNLPASVSRATILGETKPLTFTGKHKQVTILLPPKQHDLADAVVALDLAK